MDEASRVAWSEVSGEATLEGLAAMAVACEAGMRGAKGQGIEWPLAQYLLDLHGIVLAELIRRTGKGR